MAMSEREQVDDIIEAEKTADEILHFACLQFTATESEINMCLRLLGLEMALLRHAARIGLISERLCQSRNTKSVFLRLAGDMFDDVAEIRAGQIRTEARLRDKKSPGASRGDC